MRAPLRVALALAALAGCATGSGTSDSADDATDNTNQPTPDAEVRVDADPFVVADAALGTPDAPLPVGNPDSCADAYDLTAGAGGAGGVTVTGDTTGYANDTQPSSACTGFTPDGPDAVYTVDATVGDTIVASVAPTGWDASIFIASNCQLDAACLIGADAGAPNEAVSWTVQTSGTYYVVVESWDPGAFGPYALTVDLQ